MLRMDDGKMNAFSFSMITTLHRALDEAECAGSVVLTGNQRCFSAGFDLNVMGKGPSADAGRLLEEGGKLLFRLLTFPRPVVLAAPGHSMALGAIVLLAGDLRIGCSGLTKCKVGLNEVRIGMPMPRFGMEMARWRMSPRHLTRAVTLGQLYTPEEAVDVGYLDVLVSPDHLDAHALAAAQELSPLGMGNRKAFIMTKMADRGAMLEKCRQLVLQDVADFTA